MNQRVELQYNPNLGLFQNRFRTSSINKEPRNLTFAADRNAKFAELIRRARRGAGLNQYELARRMSKPQSYVSKIERSERRLTLVDLEDISIALKSDPLTVLMPLYRSKGLQK